MSFKCCVRSCAIILLMASTASAHGPQIQVTADQTGTTTRKISTREIKFDPYTPLTGPKQLYVMPAYQHTGGVWYTGPDRPANYSGPGLAYGLGHTFADNSVLSITFVDQLLKWDGGDFVDAGSTDLQGYEGGSLGSQGQLITPTATALASSGGSLAVPLGKYADPDSHATRRFRFLGDGTTVSAGSGLQIGTLPNAAPGDGIYLASFVLSSNEAGLNTSDPYYFIVYKNAPWSEVMAATRSLGIAGSLIQGIPEPTSLALVGFGLIAWISRRSSGR
jgi:hypothetical protein